MSHRSIRRAFATVSITGLAVVAIGAGPASAGEITGNGTLKPVNGKSECAYSGQNDGYHAGTEAMRVQSYGQEHKFLTEVLGLPKGLPGLACNPSGARG